jgi:uncharacterized protein YndB with AHSA1/START domain
MDNDRIERSIEIGAPTDVVWPVLTEPTEIVNWFSHAADVEIRPGARGTLTFLDGDAPMVVNLQIEEVAPPHRFAFLWDYPDGAEPSAASAPLVEFTIADVDGRTTLLTVVESGLELLSHGAEDRDLYVERHTMGWEFFLGRLAERVAGLDGR